MEVTISLPEAGSSRWGAAGSGAGCACWTSSTAEAEAARKVSRLCRTFA